MTQTAPWLRRCPDADGDTTPPPSGLPARDFPLANVLGAGANRSRKRLNYTTIFCAITLIAWALAMCF